MEQKEIFPIPQKDRVFAKEEKNIGVLEQAVRKINLMKEMRKQYNPPLLKKTAEESRKNDPKNNPNWKNLEEFDIKP